MIEALIEYFYLWHKYALNTSTCEIIRHARLSMVVGLHMKDFHCWQDYACKTMQYARKTMQYARKTMQYACKTMHARLCMQAFHYRRQYAQKTLTGEKVSMEDFQYWRKYAQKTTSGDKSKNGRLSLLTWVWTKDFNWWQK